MLPRLAPDPPPRRLADVDNLRVEARRREDEGQHLRTGDRPVASRDAVQCKVLTPALGRQEKCCGPQQIRESLRAQSMER